MNLVGQVGPDKAAEMIAREVHGNQVDKGGASYIGHPLRVAASFRPDQAKERVVALLHDVIEDGEWTPEKLLAEGFPEDVVAAVIAVSRRKGESYQSFIRRAGQDPIGREVKKADLADNMNIFRIPAPTEKDLLRLEKYRKALETLQSMNGI